MFQFPAFASLIQGMTGLQPAGLSHSEIRGSKAICASPRLIAAYHVLHRLQEPRHPPYALSYLLRLFSLLKRIEVRVLKVYFWLTPFRLLYVSSLRIPYINYKDALRFAFVFQCLY